MNELQIRITAEVQQFQAAMAKVETRLQNAEGILKKAQISADKYRGSMATLAAQLKRGEVSQEEYNKGITKISNGLRKQEDIINNSTREVDRLSKSYKDLNSNSLVQAQNQLSDATENVNTKIANGNQVVFEFGNIIRNSSSGIDGTASSIVQLGQSFSRLSSSANGSGAAIKSSLGAMVTPANAALLAVSALAAIYTVYQLNAKEAAAGVKELQDAQDALNESFKQTEQLAKAQFYNSILKEIGLVKEEFTAFGKVLIDSGLSSEEALQRIADKIKTATKPELEALESFLRLKYQESTRLATNATTELEKQLGRADASKFSQQLQIVTKELEFYSDSSDKATKKAKENLEAWTDTQWQTAIDNQEALQRALAKVTAPTDGGIIDVGVDKLLDPKAFEEVAEQLETVKVKTIDTTAQIASAFSGMSFQISEALGISDRNLRAFVGTLVSNAPKIINAIIAQAKAAKVAADLTNKANLAQAKGNVIVSATSAAKGLGPVGLALLPVLIAGGLALISGAFGKSAGGGGGAVATGSPQSFGNASIPQPTRQSLSNQTSRARPLTNSGRLEAVVTGDQIRFVLDQSGRRSGRG